MAKPSFASAQAFPTSGTSGTHSFTTSGSNRVLYVAAERAFYSGAANVSVSYGGVAMTRISGPHQVGSSKCDLWRLVNPASGANDIVWTTDGGGGSDVLISAACFADADQSTPEGSLSSAAALTTTVAGVTGDQLVAAFLLGTSEGQTPGGNLFTSTGASQTERLDSSSGPCYCSIATSSAEGDVDPTFTWGSGDAFTPQIIAFPVNGISSGSAPTAPSSVSAVAYSPTRVDLAWTNGSGQEELFVHRVASGAAAPTTSGTRLSSDLGDSATSYSDTAASAGTAYDYYVEAVNGTGSTFSASAASASTPAQTVRPDADASAGGWTPSTGSDLFAVIDEVVPNDADYMQSGELASGQSDTTLIRLEELTNPEDGDNVIRYRYGKDASGGAQIDLRVALVDTDGSTELGDANDHEDIGTTITDGTLTYDGDLGDGPYFVKFTASSPS